jgi:hypothetical protein
MNGRLDTLDSVVLSCICGAGLEEGYPNGSAPPFDR